MQSSRLRSSSILSNRFLTSQSFVLNAAHSVRLRKKITKRQNTPSKSAPAAPPPRTRYTTRVFSSTLWQLPTGGAAWLMMFLSFLLGKVLVFPVCPWGWEYLPVIISRVLIQLWIFGESYSTQKRWNNGGGELHVDRRLEIQRLWYRSVIFLYWLRGIVSAEQSEEEVMQGDETWVYMRSLLVAEPREYIWDGIVMSSSFGPISSRITSWTQFILRTQGQWVVYHLNIAQKRLRGDGFTYSVF